MASKTSTTQRVVLLARQPAVVFFNSVRGFGFWNYVDNLIVTTVIGAHVVLLATIAVNMTRNLSSWLSVFGVPPLLTAVVIALCVGATIGLFLAWYAWDQIHRPYLVVLPLPRRCRLQAYSLLAGALLLGLIALSAGCAALMDVRQPVSGFFAPAIAASVLAIILYGRSGRDNPTQHAKDNAEQNKPLPRLHVAALQTAKGRYALLERWWAEEKRFAILFKGPLRDLPQALIATVTLAMLLAAAIQNAPLFWLIGTHLPGAYLFVSMINLRGIGSPVLQAQPLGFFRALLFALRLPTMAALGATFPLLLLGFGLGVVQFDQMAWSLAGFAFVACLFTAALAYARGKKASSLAIIIAFVIVVSVYAEYLSEAAILLPLLGIALLLAGARRRFLREP